MQVSLVLELYEKHNQVLKNTLDVEFSDLEFFRRALSVPDHDPLMHGSYKIDDSSNIDIFDKYGFMRHYGASATNRNGATLMAVSQIAATARALISVAANVI